MRAYYDMDANPEILKRERVAVLGYGIQGRAQALNLRDSGVSVVVGNRHDSYEETARGDGFEVFSLGEATRQASLVLLLLPDEVQPQVFPSEVAPGLLEGNGLVVAHGFVLRYGLISAPPQVDLMMLAPRMPGRYLRSRYLAGWGVPAFVSVEHDWTGHARDRLLALSFALGITRCAALEVSAAIETELDLFSEHFTFPLIFRALELAFECLVDAGYPPEAALMELHGSGELGEVLSAASREGLYEMIETHASPACQVGLARNWEEAPGPEEDLRRTIGRVLADIRDGGFCHYLLNQQAEGHPDLGRWHRRQSRALIQAGERLRMILRRPQPTPSRGGNPEPE